MSGLSTIHLHVNFTQVTLGHGLEMPLGANQDLRLLSHDCKYMVVGTAHTGVRYCTEHL